MINEQAVAAVGTAERIPQISALLAAEDIWFAYYDVETLCGVSLRLAPGEIASLVGPNGSGKTTLLKVLSGILIPQRGRVMLDGTDLRRLSRRAIAQRIAVVPQEVHVPFTFTAEEIISMGRTPHVRSWWGAGRADREVVQRVMAATHTEALAHRPFNELSGGEQQRVVIAMALAQEPRVLLLDEPTVHLDINHQIEILELLVRLNREEGLTVLATMHDLNMAALYFDRLVMLKEGRIVAEGAPEEVIHADNIRLVFDADVQVHIHPTRRRPQILVLPIVA